LRIHKVLHTVKKSLSKLAVPILALPRAAKPFVALLVDGGLCVLTVWLAYYLRLGEFVALSGNALWAVGVLGLSGLSVRDDQNPDGDIAIEVTGLRPGEKLCEELFS
jgi:hypothetical protein